MAEVYERHQRRGPEFMSNRYKLPAILLLAVVLRIVGYAGYVAGDDWHYLTSAVELARGEVSSNGGHWQGRIAVTIPAAFFYWLGAPTWLILGGMTFFWSMVCVVTAYWLAREVTGDRHVSLLAAFLVAVFPLDIIYATCLYPIMGLAATTALTGLFFIRAMRTKATADYFLIGVFLGLGYLHKVTALFIGLPMLVWVIGSKEWRWKLSLSALSFFLIVALETGFFAYTEGDPLRRLHVLAKASGTKKLKPIRPGGKLLSPVVALATNQELGLYYCLAPIAVVTLLRRRAENHAPSTCRPKLFGFVLLWFVLVTIYTLWGTTSPFSYRQLRPWPRYLSHVTVPLAVILASWLVWCLRSRSRTCVLALLIATSLLGVCLDSSRTIRKTGILLLKTRESFGEVDVAVERIAYLHMYTAANCRPPSRVAVMPLHPSGKDPRMQLLRKLERNISFHQSWEDVPDGYVIVGKGHVKSVPRNWTRIKTVQISERPILTLLSRMSKPTRWLAKKLDNRPQFEIYQVSRQPN